MTYCTPTPTTRVYFANGMENSIKEAKSSAEAISKLINQPVGVIVNKTHGLFGDKTGVGDIPEYLKNQYTMKDIINEYTYRKINNEAKKAKTKALIILHSAANEDAPKFISLGKKLGYTYPNLEFISAGSPNSKRKLSNIFKSANAKLIGQVNDWRDPVTHSKTVAAGVIGLGLVGAYFSPEISAIGLAGKTAIGKFAAGAAAGAVGVIGGVNLFHPFKTYLKKPKLRDMIKQSVFNLKAEK
ncbi:MAG: hypothetical protein GXP61_11420 [Epsilonproteobacteria bacterium]|nr:hypothetical protein [Campylobacterota bacterium]